ncbi:MAG: bacillithiol biosynthesis deacetylase BshB1 [Asgard group archaeon]|nr:bacillithiol biosynthesis deacetylase BshB1 [Asgard group archaeon]
MLDVLVFSPHPDDAELGAGGAIVKAVKSGLKIGIIDLTAGEMGTHGTKEIRLSESQKAAKVLGIDIRENLELPDGYLTYKIDKKTTLLITEKIREFKPRIVLVPYWDDRHPDHIAAYKIITDAIHYAKLVKIKLDNPKHKVEKTIIYEINGQFSPSFIMDISDEFETKKKAIMTHASQFKEFTMEYLPFPVEERCQYYGSLLFSKYGEAFLMKEQLAINNWNCLIDK